MSDTTTTRVFHPTLRESYDIADAVVKDWTDAGWLTDAPDYDALQDNAAEAPKPARGSKADDKAQQ